MLVLSVPITVKAYLVMITVMAGGSMVIAVSLI